MRRLRSAAARHQAAVLSEVTDGVLRLAERLVEAREVVVTVGEVGILLERGLVGIERRTDVAEILEQHALVEEQQRVAPGLAQAALVDVRGLLRLTLLVQQPAPVGPGGDVLRISLRRL